MKINCPKCDNEIDEGAKFCEHCGENITSTDDLLLCPSCGASNKKDNKFCLKCGNQLNDIICPYCNSHLDAGVLKCKYCGEWVNKPLNINSSILNYNSRLLTIVAYILTLINLLITWVMLSTPFIMLSGILLINLIWTIISLIFAFYVLSKFSQEKVKFLFNFTVKKHMIIVLIVNIIFLLPQIFALFWTPF